ncbi:hypothetical protein FYK55_26650 [Roseiconus nitratireducens]|uniref:Secreted protein n=1 Tax=Roseiconus nitratireducens TaxID=2605748 RepID=A0A5M6CUR3_9BACT|nr:CehA/McbA family metallohydrolase [Roseiconus nitratireducens]KAA5538696.1 hypothetical protein FYK55_26650 [Roseiconus nitratireducens]
MARFRLLVGCLPSRSAGDLQVRCCTSSKVSGVVRAMFGPRVVAVLLASVGSIVDREASAHEDHYVPKEVTIPKPSEQERQFALAQFELLTQLARTAPSPLQTAQVDLAYAEHLRANDSPHALEEQRLTAMRKQMVDDLARQHTVIPVRWSGASMECDRPERLELADGIARVVLLSVANQTERALELAAKFAESESVPFTVHPGRTQLIPVRIWNVTAESTRCDVSVCDQSSPDDWREVSIPIRVVQPATLRGTLVDALSGDPCSGRVYVEGSDGQYRHGGRFAAVQAMSEKQLLQFMPMGRNYRVPFFYSDGAFEVSVPPGRTSVCFEGGFEHHRDRRTLDLKPGEVREVVLHAKRLVDMADRGWVSGDTHVHWVTNAWNVDLPLEWLSVIQRAEDVRVVNNLTLLHRTENQAFVNPSQAPMGPVQAFCDDQYHLQMGEEYRNENLYGHLCFLNLKWLVMPIGTGRMIAGEDTLDYPINKNAILACREQGGISCEAHGLGGNKDVPVNVVHQLTDSLDQIRPEEYYNFLECGFHLPLTNGSDHPARLVGSARAYVKIEPPFSYSKWIDGIRQCRTFTTSGPLIFLSVNQAGIGDTLTVAASDRLSVRCEVMSRDPIGRLQVISNKQVLRETTTEESHAVLEFEITAQESRWIVARCFPESVVAPEGQHHNPIWVRDAAHTSAVYVNIDDRPRFNPDAARLWTDRMRQHILDIKTKGRFANQRQRAEAIDYVRSGIDRFETMIQQATSSDENK